MGNSCKTTGTLLRTILACTGFLLATQGALAHHSIEGEFDTSIEFELRGTLTRIDWANPHIWYYLDVANDEGIIEQWQCSTGANPNRLVRAGWQKEDLPIGSQVWIARASPAWDDPHTCILRGNMAFDGGTPVFAGQKPE